MCFSLGAGAGQGPRWCAGCCANSDSGQGEKSDHTLVESYVVSKLHLYHFDFYRFTDPEEWEAAGFRDLFDNTNICLVEWPEGAVASADSRFVDQARPFGPTRNAAIVLAQGTDDGSDPASPANTSRFVTKRQRPPHDLLTAPLAFAVLVSITRARGKVSSTRVWQVTNTRA